MLLKRPSEGPIVPPAPLDLPKSQAHRKTVVCQASGSAGAESSRTCLIASDPVFAWSQITSAA